MSDRHNFELFDLPPSARWEYYVQSCVSWQTNFEFFLVLTVMNPPIFEYQFDVLLIDLVVHRQFGILPSLSVEITLLLFPTAARYREVSGACIHPQMGDNGWGVLVPLPLEGHHHTVKSMILACSQFWFLQDYSTTLFEWRLISTRHDVAGDYAPLEWRLAHAFCGRAKSWSPWFWVGLIIVCDLYGDSDDDVAWFTIVSLFSSMVEDNSDWSSVRKSAAREWLRVCKCSGRPYGNSDLLPLVKSYWFRYVWQSIWAGITRPRWVTWARGN